ncbi:hydrogen peroxide-inducible genes activator [Glaciecola petra]|uniref:LysR substrate-binding domain-containing protein n=1 Tax=Glaciecola petra TaxID=3075602 RepID=A0ABU2ZPF6_9ALTE|nr:LysR substrate-binding domain-containing protein [Aestuariibacter sp. P117]MDT0593479.1 LysR substrate-binding domain-containing protein [Aestuariibacter sp. P117]
MRLPNLKHLYYFTVLHKEQHFLRAAEKCNVSQSTLSAAIQNLEETIGQQLLEREHKTFVFTDFGETLVERSKLLLSQTQEWMTFAQSSGDWQSGVLKLGVIPTIAPFIFESLIKVVKENLPKIELKLIEDTTDNLMEKLMDGDLDLLILALPMTTSGCKQLLLGRDPFHLIAHKEKAKLLPENVNIDALPENSIFLLQKEHCLTEHAVSACGLAHKAQVSTLAASSLHTLVSLVNSQMGYTFLPSLALNKGILEGSEVIALPSNDNASREIGLVWRNGTTRMQLFRQIAKLVAPLTPEPNQF